MGDVPSQIVVRRLFPGDCSAVATMFRTFVGHQVDAFFHPHAFDALQASRVCSNGGRDYYCCSWEGSVATGYGMLRGLDEGYAVPSVGIAVTPEFQRRRIGQLLMRHLHEVALSLGAKKTMLRVHPENDRALGFYRSLGYEFSSEMMRGELLGHFRLLR